jgi:VWFA-related protein
MRRILTACIICAGAAVGQQVGQNTTPARPAATFSSSTQLVVETVVVTDKAGKPVEGLTANDFTVTEDGAPQAIRFFEFQKLPDGPNPAPLAPIDPKNVAAFEKLPHGQIAPESPGDTHYKDSRLLALYFDMTAMPPADQARALSAAQKFVRTQMTAADRMAIMTYAGGSVDVRQDFTDNRERLLGMLETLIIGEGDGLDENSNDDSTPDTGAAFGQDDSEFNIFNTDRQLAALQTAARMLGTLSE